MKYSSLSLRNPSKKKRSKINLNKFLFGLMGIAVASWLLIVQLLRHRLPDPTSELPIIQSNLGESHYQEKKREIRTPKQHSSFDNNIHHKKKQSQTYHIVFSTACSIKHDWQSYLFFYQAMVHQQSGTVTRIVSGCEPAEQVELQKQHDEQIKIMSSSFHLHFAPEFGRNAVPGVSYQKTKYWNKPFGMKHWMENQFGYHYNSNGEVEPNPEYDDDIVVLVDPDMLLQRPFVNDFTQTPFHVWQEKSFHGSKKVLTKVTQGYPMAQDYNFGIKWLQKVKETNLTHVVGTDSPVHDLSTHDASTLYPAGPPYIATARDMYRMVYHWCRFLPKIFDLLPVFMAEMYGYCMAAAHLKLPHQLARGFMISNVALSGGEGWNFITLENGPRVCQDDFVSSNERDVPQVLHFCQRYSIDEYFISKYKVPTDLLSCDFPLIKLPPPTIAATAQTSHYGDNSLHTWRESDIHKYRHAFMVCQIFQSLNAAATFWKDHHCTGKTANYDKSWNHFQTKEWLEKEGRVPPKTA